MSLTTLGDFVKPVDNQESRNSNESHLNSLPEDLIFAIFSQFDLATLVNISLVNNCQIVVGGSVRSEIKILNDLCDLGIIDPCGFAKVGILALRNLSK